MGKEKEEKPLPIEPIEKDKEKEKKEREKKVKEAKEFIAKTKPKMTIASGNKVYEVDAKFIIGMLKGTD